MAVAEPDKCTVVRADFDALFGALRKAGYDTYGPTLRDGAIVYDAVTSSGDLPAGWADQQDPGRYRLRRRDDQALFAYAVGPQSWKRFLHEPGVRLYQISVGPNSTWKIAPDPPPPRPMAFIGMRACELHALSIRDRVLLRGKYADPAYREARASVFLVAVHCTHPASSCFCASMNSGPRCPDGYDLAVTEILEGEHRFLIESGTEAGRQVLRQLPRHEAAPEDLDAAEGALQEASAHVSRTLDTRGLKQHLYASVEHPAWERIAGRCMACGNCTMVCPTCFCTTLEDSSDVTGSTAERRRFWDSCFSLQFSYIHGGSVRNSVSARYRHRILHKLTSWWDQFGTSGCTGCGRCSTWCPAGIDLTAEIRGLRQSTSGVAI